MNDIKEKIQNILQTTPKPVAANKRWLFLHHPIIYNFLKEKYSTFEEDSLSETYYRILNDIDEKPKCIVCGKPVHFQKDGINQYRQFCSKTCLNNTPEGIKIKFDKAAKTNLERYGAENPYASPIIKEKLRKTWLERYGAENPYASEEIKGRIKNTLISKYGVDNPQKSEIIKEKTAQTNIKKYGNKMYLQSNEGIKKSKQIIKEKYGDEIFSHTDEYKARLPEILKKRFETLKHKNLYNSKIEKDFKAYLEQNYSNDFEYQYKTNLYPFHCDFYINSLDLYIEIQGTWVHGFHPFNENNVEDLKRLEFMKSKNSPFYNTAIYVWTIGDVKKRNIAKANNLNYLEIFSNKIDVCIQELNNYIKSLP